MEAARPARWSDAARLVELCRAALDEIGGERGGLQLAADLLMGRDVEQLVDSALGDPDAFVVAGEYDGVILAVGIATAAPPVGWRGPHPPPGLARVQTLYVDPGARTVGLGEAVLDEMLAWAARRGCTGIDAVALPGSRHTKAFYETNGLTARALVMHRSLGDPAGG